MIYRITVRQPLICMGRRGFQGYHSATYRVNHYFSSMGKVKQFIAQHAKRWEAALGTVWREADLRKSPTPKTKLEVIALLRLWGDQTGGRL